MSSINEQEINSREVVRAASSLSLLENFEEIIKYSKDSKLDDEFFNRVKANIDIVNKFLKLNDIQVVLLSIMLNNYDNDYSSFSAIEKHLDCGSIRLLSFREDFDKLLDKRYIIADGARNRRSVTYHIPSDLVLSIIKGKKYKQTKKVNLNSDELFSCIDSLMMSLEEDELDYNKFVSEVINLLKENKHIDFAFKMLNYRNRMNDKIDFTILVIFCKLFINNGDNCIGFHDFEEYFSRKERGSIRRSFLWKTNSLFSLGLVESNIDNGFSSTDFFNLTDKAKEELFSEMDIKALKSIEGRKKDIINVDSIVQKDLFYNDRERGQIEQLGALLGEDNFKSVQDRLKENGLRTGFACLFYGSPGTGKTETVYQLAKKTNRDIFMVDISETKSMWFGESEKRIKQIFSTYKELVKNSKTIPILLFNEADAVIGKRKDSSSGNVAQTENAIQNIILQEMENLEGIMIATTNLTNNLDKAFERRFLYKIEFDKPSIEAKKSIWKTMLSEINEEEVIELASIYDFSGGQIENISRKYLIDKVVFGKNPSLNELKNICDVELLERKSGASRLGFRPIST